MATIDGERSSACHERHARGGAGVRPRRTDGWEDGDLAGGNGEALTNQLAALGDGRKLLWRGVSDACVA